MDRLVKAVQREQSAGVPMNSEAGFPTPLDEYKLRVARKVEEMRRHDGIIRMGRLFRDQHAQVGRKRQHLLLMFRGWHSARVGDVCADGL